MPDSNRPASGPQSAASYRQKSLNLCAAAAKTSDPLIRAELESLAFAYSQLAEKTERPTQATDRGEDDVKPEKG
jgi:hypothetical protein